MLGEDLLDQGRMALLHVGLKILRCYFGATRVVNQDGNRHIGGDGAIGKVD